MRYRPGAGFSFLVSHFKWQGTFSRWRRGGGKRTCPNHYVQMYQRRFCDIEIMKLDDDSDDDDGVTFVDLTLSANAIPLPNRVPPIFKCAWRTLIGGVGGPPA